jgi:TonB family protein
MRHGIDAYFDGLAQDSRRVAFIGIVVSLALLGGELALYRSAVMAALNDPRRFGFEGPEQYARHILLEQVADVDRPGAAAQNIVPIELHAGGGKTKHKPVERGTIPGGTRHAVGSGVDDQSVVSRMRAMALEGPVIRSEDLVVERLVRPEYPEEARSGNIEGLVELVALVDTTGGVAEVHIIGGTRDPLLEHAATTAALQSRYRPYRPARADTRTPEQVWAYFRVHFTLY